MAVYGIGSMYGRNIERKSEFKKSLLHPSVNW